MEDRTDLLFLSMAGLFGSRETKLPNIFSKWFSGCPMKVQDSSSKSGPVERAKAA